MFPFVYSSICCIVFSRIIFDATHASILNQHAKIVGGSIVGMLRITVDVNGRPIGQVAAVRTSEEASGTNTYEIYDCRDVDSGESVVEEGELLGEVEHMYSEGAAKLTELVMAEVQSFPD